MRCRNTSLAKYFYKNCLLNRFVGFDDGEGKYGVVRSFSCTLGAEKNWYSSKEATTGYWHAVRFDDLGIDFIIFEISNLSKFHPPSATTFKHAKEIIKGMRQAHSEGKIKKKIGFTFEFSITVSGEQYDMRSFAEQFPEIPNIGNRFCEMRASKKEFFTFGKYMIEHVKEAYKLYEQAKSEGHDDFVE